MASEPDMSLINELLEEIERKPPGIEARKLLIEQFMTAGWMDAARDAVQQLARFCSDDDVKNLKAALFRIYDTKPPPPPYSAQASSSAALPKRIVRSSIPSMVPAVLPTEPRELQIEKQNLVQGYKLFRAKAKDLLQHHNFLQGFRQRKGLSIQDSHGQNLENLSTGRIISVLRQQPAPSDQTDSNSARSPNSARAVAKKMLASPKDAPEMVLQDFEFMLEWLPSSMDNDNRREMLARRVRTLNAALPNTMHFQTQTAMMHMEHERLDRKYVNDETMLGDTIPEILREEFIVTEDNYAWSMGELVQAITSNNGVFRNPLSKHMFTPNDIASILHHPLGQSLAALQIEQGKLKRGVRPKTMEEMDRMAKGKFI
jgi:hypothetical protein